MSLIVRMLNIGGTLNQCGLPNQKLPAISPFVFYTVRYLVVIYAYARMKHIFLELTLAARRRHLRC